MAIKKMAAKKVVKKTAVKKPIAKKPIRKMQDGGTKKPLRTKEVINTSTPPKNPSLEVNASTPVKGFKTTRTSPITGRTIEKTQVTVGNYMPDEMRSKVVTDKDGNVIKRKKTEIAVGAKANTYSSIPGGYAPIKKTVTKTKKERVPYGFGIEVEEDKLRTTKESQKVKNFPTGRVVLSADKLRANQNIDDFKNKGIKTLVPNYKKGGVKKSTTKKVVMRKGGKITKGMGFKAVQTQIANKQGISMERAGAILAAGARKASPAAKRKNPNLKKVKMKK